MADSLAKSPWVVHLNCNSCNGCDIEFLACLTPTYDVERFGVLHVGNPKHADVLVVTGSVNHRNARVLRNVYDQMPDPKVVVALGVCSSSGGVFADGYNVLGGVDKVVPVDVFVPGCPPRPEAIIDGFVKAVARLEAKGRGRTLQPAAKPTETVAPPAAPHRFSNPALEIIEGLLMSVLTNVKDVTRNNLLEEVAARIPQGFRFVTMTCVDNGDAFDLLYHFDRNYELVHLRLKLGKNETLPSISHMIFAAALVENEIKDLFGIDIKGLAIDYGGRFLLSEGAPIAPMRKPDAPPSAAPVSPEKS